MSMEAYWTIRARLLQVPGVANVAIWGERLQMMTVQVEPKQLLAQNVPLESVMEATSDSVDSGLLKFSSGSVIGAGGYVDTANQQLGIRNVLPIVTPADLAKVTASSVPLVDIVGYWMGDVAKLVFGLIVVFSIFALDVIGLAATGRLIFSFARDNIIPFSSALKKVNPQTQTPIRALATASALGLVFVAWGYISALTGKGNSQFLLLITATATLPFVVYFLTVLAYVTRRHRMDKLPEAFDLGVWAKPVMYAALAWTVIALAALMIPKDFWGADVIVVIVLVVAAAWYFGALRGRLARGEAGVEQLKA